jgi:hypothetical protein
VIRVIEVHTIGLKPHDFGGESLTDASGHLFVALAVAA